VQRQRIGLVVIRGPKALRPHCGDHRGLVGVAPAGRVFLERPDRHALVGDGTLLAPDGQLPEESPIRVCRIHAGVPAHLLEVHRLRLTCQQCQLIEPAIEAQVTVWGEAVVGGSQERVLEEIVSAYAHRVLDRTLILSMELYCAALLEPNERVRFITVVSALEPLVKQENLGAEVSAFVEKVVAVLESSEEIQASLRASLRGRVNQLRQESVRHALFRLSNTWFPQREDVLERIDRAYSLRSELLHEGTLLDPDTDMAAETTQISKILRAIYERASGRTFQSRVVV